jgi:DNA-directed RNA polymerase specialized sigma24 family protein
MHSCNWERAVLADDYPAPIGRPSQSVLAKSIEPRLPGQMAGGDGSALQSLYVSYFPSLTRLFSHLTASSSAATIAYLVNETLLAAGRASEDVHSNDSAYVRIMRLAVDQARHRLRGDSLIAASLRPDTACGESPPYSSRTLLRPLSLEQRAVMYLVYTSHSRQTIADILRLSSQSVDALLTQARIELARRPSLAGNRAPSNP